MDQLESMLRVLLSQVEHMRRLVRRREDGEFICCLDYCFLSLIVFEIFESFCVTSQLPNPVRSTPLLLPVSSLLSIGRVNRELGVSVSLFIVITWI